MTGLIVTHRHLFTIPGLTRRPGFCRGQSRAWFQRHGLDWRAFVRDGIPAEQLLATGCGMAEALVAWARECEAKESGGGR